MSDLSDSQLRRLDLSLLLVFLGLLRHRKAALVAAELSLTQSAISQALKRLRDVFGDPLFLRLPHGMEPTATALALELPVAQAVSALRSALKSARAFEPTLAEGVVRIAALDAEQSVLVPRLVERVAHLAPKLAFSVIPLGRRAAVEALVDGRADLALGYVWEAPDVLIRKKIYDESFLVVGKPAILPDAPDLSLDAYCAANHVLVSPGGDLRGVVDDRLEALGRTRRIVLGLPSFLPAFAVVASSDAIVTVPSRIARDFAPGFGLAVAEPPLDIRRFPVSVFWHRRNDQDPLTRWLLQFLRE
ncbi:LysR family transcriptional regulator [Rhizobium alvei]|uniref:LysR substrate-binding domain-containing protein n=1 Tax=Rhizobium alvei TaxID=1132659 RepID=A0ABT8YMS9_9HYPH|nr:LysR family transcriptional regulator [Rhizobium alvei]MDO6964658.1 LysR substrate-binding domain-containing protein [Rhizobium alvei]